MMDLIDRNQLLKDHKFIYDKNGNPVAECTFVKIEDIENAPTVKAYTVEELVKYFKKRIDYINANMYCFYGDERFYIDGELSMLLNLVDNLTEYGELR